jgi:S-adenosylmethionine decarboxylase
MAVSPPDRVVSAAFAPVLSAGSASSVQGAEWIIDARGCDADVLRDAARLRALFDRLIAELHLTPVAPAVWHRFPSPGGLTGFVILAESHLACHTFPEFGSICVNVFCCRERDDFDAARLMAEMLGATDTLVRRIERTYGAPGPGCRFPIAGSGVPIAGCRPAEAGNP